MSTNHRILIWGKIPLDTLQKQDLIDQLSRWAMNRVTRLVYYVNIHQLRLFEENQEYRRVLKRADLIYPDGEGAVVAAKSTGLPIRQRTTAADFYPLLFDRFAQKKVRLFLLGGEKRVVEAASRSIGIKFPGLKIVGWHHGYFRKNRTILDLINKSGANALLVGFGSPKQEIWIEKNKTKLKNLGLIWAVGGLFNYWAGNWRRAPRLIIKLKLEWLYRCLLEPKRLTFRYLKDLLNLIRQLVGYKTNNC